MERDWPSWPLVPRLKMSRGGDWPFMASMGYEGGKTTLRAQFVAVDGISILISVHTSIHAFTYEWKIEENEIKFSMKGGWQDVL